VREGTVTSLGGVRENPITGKQEFHDGVDIGCPVGTEVFSAFDGTVLAAGQSSSFGKYIRLAYSNGYTAFYAHLSEYDVKKGDTVSRGQVVALSGNTGRSTGPHLHYSLYKDGQYVNASDYVALPLNERIVAAGGAD
jgi:murein DD-endopeptidase MepM/ murein hydrolase activator NlpD